MVTIIGNPIPKERPRHNAKTGITYTPAKTKNAERDIGIAYINQDGTLYSGPVTVELKFYLRKPKKPLHEEPLKRPDMDNLIKTVLDGLNGIAYEDDKQIIKISAEKHWADDEPRTEILVYEYKNNI